MVLATHKLQSSHVSVPSRPSPWSKGIRLKQHVMLLQTVPRTDRRISLKLTLPLRLGGHHSHEARGKHFKISSFKGNAQNNEASSGSSKSKFPKTSVKISYLPDEREEGLADSRKAQDVPVSSAANDTTSGSKAIRRLFANWLTLLRTESPGQVEDEIKDRPSFVEQSPVKDKASSEERGEILKVVLSYFLGLDATIKIPLLIFVPLYLTVNVVYGSEVSRELNPLWIIGPILVALYIKLLRGIFSLYVFAFKQTVKIIKNLPTYYLVTRTYVSEGKLKEEIKTRIWQPVVNIKNMNYKEVTWKKWKEFEEWMVEKYLDFVESIWPYYCRTIRFLKRANLI